MILTRGLGQGGALVTAGLALGPAELVVEVAERSSRSLWARLRPAFGATAGINAPGALRLRAGLVAGAGFTASTPMAQPASVLLAGASLRSSASHIQAYGTGSVSAQATQRKRARVGRVTASGSVAAVVWGGYSATSAGAVALIPVAHADLRGALLAAAGGSALASGVVNPSDMALIQAALDARRAPQGRRSAPLRVVTQSAPRSVPPGSPDISDEDLIRLVLDLRRKRQGRRPTPLRAAKGLTRGERQRMFASTH